MNALPRDDRKKHVTVERDKLRQTSHWDVDYLPWTEVEALYDRQAEPRSANVPPVPNAPKTISDRRIGILCIAAGVGLLLLAAVTARLVAG